MSAAARKAKVLVLCPHPEESGGVSHYYSLVARHFRSERVHLEFLYTGRSSAGGWGRGVRPLADLFSLVRALPLHDLVLLNPSLDPKAILRDGVYHLVARWSGKKTVVFFRGWSPKWEGVIDRYAQGVFRRVFRADRVVILCSRFADTLSAWGFPAASLVRETTTYEHHESDLVKEPQKLIFLSRFAPGKGCLVAIQAAELLAREFPELKLYMAGEGPELPQLQEYVRERGLGAQVEFTGWLSGESKQRLLGECGIMLFPTDYGEGMPNALVEGMGMGIAIVSRPVAGICDIIKEGENGYLVPSLDPADFAGKVALLLRDRGLWQAISQRNREAGRENYSIASVVARLESLCIQVVGEGSGGER